MVPPLISDSNQEEKEGQRNITCKNKSSLWPAKNKNFVSSSSPLGDGDVKLPRDIKYINHGHVGAKQPLATKSLVLC